MVEKPDITIPITVLRFANETWNDCPSCGKAWKDEISTPGLLHRTKLCAECADKKYK